MSLQVEVLSSNYVKKIIIIIIIINVVMYFSHCNKSLGDVNTFMLMDFFLVLLFPSCGLKLLDVTCCCCGWSIGWSACCVVTLAVAAKEEEKKHL